MSDIQPLIEIEEAIALATGETGVEVNRRLTERLGPQQQRQFTKTRKGR